MTTALGVLGINPMMLSLFFCDVDVDLELELHLGAERCDDFRFSGRTNVESVGPTRESKQPKPLQGSSSFFSFSKRATLHERSKLLGTNQHA